MKKIITVWKNKNERTNDRKIKSTCVWCEVQVWNKSSDHKAYRFVFNNGTLIVYIEYDVSSISKWSWHPTLKSLAVRDSFSLLVTYGCISIKTICGYNLETHVSLVITKFNVSWAKSDQNLCEGFMTILPYVWFCNSAGGKVAATRCRGDNCGFVSKFLGSIWLFRHFQ